MDVNVRKPLDWNNLDIKKLAQAERNMVINNMLLSHSGKDNTPEYWAKIADNQVDECIVCFKQGKNNNPFGIYLCETHLNTMDNLYNFNKAQGLSTGRRDFIHQFKQITVGMDENFIDFEGYTPTCEVCGAVQCDFDKHQVFLCDKCSADIYDFDVIFQPEIYKGLNWMCRLEKKKELFNENGGNK